MPISGKRAGAPIAGADDGVLRAEDVLLRLRNVVAVYRDEAGLQILVDPQVEEDARYRTNLRDPCSNTEANFLLRPARGPGPAQIVEQSPPLQTLGANQINNGPPPSL